MRKPSHDSADSLDTARARTVRVTDAEAGQRVDNFLMRRASGVPRSHVYQLIRKGKVLVDGRRVKPDRKLLDGEQVLVPALQVRKSTDVRVPDAMAEKLRDSIVYEHEDFFAVAKPAGIAVHGGSGIAFGVIDALRQALDQPKLELVHRLDRATSGCLLVARDLKRCRGLQALFRDRTIEKRYLALVDGAWPATRTTVDAPLQKNTEHAGERRVMVHLQGQTAVTHFQILESFRETTLLDVSLETGRTHQIRVHALHAGHALIGDTRYGSNRVNQQFKRQGLARLYLHSRKLGFDWEGGRVEIDVSPDLDWQQCIRQLRRTTSAREKQ